jgi:hypothetical protein
VKPCLTKSNPPEPTPAPKSRRPRRSRFRFTCVAGRPESRDVPTIDGSHSAISGPMLMLSRFGRDNEALDRHRPDHKPCLPLPPQRFAITLSQTPKPSAQRRHGNSKLLSPLFLDLAASARCRQRTALTPQAIPLSLPPQMHFPNPARRHRS